MKEGYFRPFVRAFFWVLCPVFSPMFQQPAQAVGFPWTPVRVNCQSIP